MPGAEQKNRTGRFAEMLLEALRIEGARRLLKVFPGAGRDPARDAAIAVDAAVGNEGACPLRLLQPPHRKRVAGIKGFGEGLHRTATALAEIGPERPIAE